MPKAFFVLNPVTGLFPPHVHRRWFENHFRQMGWDYVVYETTGKEDLAKIVRHQIDNSIDLIVASGGDGTISGVASGMVNSRVPLGILPTGTANLFSRDIGIPIDHDRALKLLTGKHSLLELDLMISMNRAFVMNMSVGLSAKTIHHTEREQKRRFGLFAYMWNGAANLFGYHQETFNLVIDGTQRKVKASEIMVANSSLIGLRTLQQNKEIIPDDGKVEICVFRARTLVDWLVVIRNVIIRHSERNTRFRLFYASDYISIKTRKPLLIQGDGEILGTTPVEIKILPRALRIIVPLTSQPFINLTNPFNFVQNSIIQKSKIKNSKNTLKD